MVLPLIALAVGAAGAAATANQARKARRQQQNQHNELTQQSNDMRDQAQVNADWQGRQWDQAVNLFGTQVGSYQQPVMNLGTQIGGLTIADLWNNPATSRNENPLGSLTSEIDNLSGRLSGLSLSMDRPNLQSSVATPMGPMSINLPMLASPTGFQTQQQQLIDQLGGFSQQLQGLQQQRAAEEARISEFSQNFMNDINALTAGIGALGVGDAMQLAMSQSQLEALERRKQGFSSLILDQVMPDFRDTKLGAIGSARGALEALTGQREAELGRISDKQATLEQTIADLTQRAQSLSITNPAAAQALMREAEAAARAAQSFSSALPTNFQPQLSALQGLSMDAGSILDQRAQEENRLFSAGGDIWNRLLQLDMATANASPMNQGNLDVLMAEIARLEQDARGINSPLQFDLGDIDSRFGAMRDRLGEVGQQREAMLDQIGGLISAPMAGFEGVPLHDEMRKMQILNQLSQAQGALSQFSGAGTTDLMNQLNANMGQVQARLAELGQKRDSLSQRARSFADTVTGQEFYGTDDLRDPVRRLEQLMRDVNLYGAWGATSGISDAERRLLSEMHRLQRDEGNTAARLEDARERTLASLGPDGVPTINLFSGVSPEFEQLMQSLMARSEEEAMFTDPASAFSSALFELAA